MKRTYWLLLFFCFSLSLSGQRNSDYGVLAGSSSYLGDINPDKLLYTPRLAGGIIYRFNFNPRQALRTNILYSVIQAKNTNGQVSVSTTVLEWALQYEFNFFPYSTEGKRWNYTPYFAAGAGIAYIDVTEHKWQPIIPFSFGFKVNIYKNMGLEAEYGFRKTFFDNFDGVTDPIAPEDVPWIHNNDWYSFLGVGVTWKMFNRLAGCMDYSNGGPKRRKH
jgi:hypothetical protein